jgi:DNA-binding response OmpR family regulator
MNVRLGLLLTRDRVLESLLAEAFRKSGASMLLARSVAEALQVACNLLHHLDLVVIDLDNGCHGMTLLSAINTCCPDLQIVAVASKECRILTLAHANGATACLVKPVSGGELGVFVSKLDESKPRLVVA